MKTFWEAWRQEVPADVPKDQLIDQLASFWGITRHPARTRLKAGRFEVVKDLKAIHHICFISFDLEKGFSFDRKAYENHLKQEELNFAKSLKLSK